MSEENIMTIVFLSIIYGISVVLTFIMSLATAGVIGIKSKSLSILISVIFGILHAIVLLLFPWFFLSAALIIETYENIISWWKYGDFVAKLKLIYRVQLQGYGNGCLMHEDVYEKMIRQNRRALKNTGISILC